MCKILGSKTVESSLDKLKEEGIRVLLNVILLKYISKNFLSIQSRSDIYRILFLSDKVQSTLKWTHGSFSTSNNEYLLLPSKIKFL